ncbi:MAG: glycoside hydrolase family 2 protein [Anaerolineae bacterium]
MQILKGPWLLATDAANVGREERWFDAPRPEAQAAPVPGIIQQVFPHYNGAAWYWQTFTPNLPAGPGLCYQVHFQGGVDYKGDVWLNGKYLGGYEGGEAPFDVDATAALVLGQPNLLAVRVLSPGNEPVDGMTLPEVPHRNKVKPFRVGGGFAYGGILQPVELRAVPAVRVTDVFARPDLSTGDVPITVTLQNDTAGRVECTLETAIGPAVAEGPAELDRRSQHIALPAGETVVEVLLHVDAPRAWSLDDPALYRVSTRTQAEVEGAPLASAYSVRCGFRTFCVKNGFFRLNGKRVLLRSSHSGNHFPVIQQAPPTRDLLWRDLVYAKASGFNCVRFIAGVAWPEQLELCDELGLMVYEECFAGWCLQDSPHMGERFDRNTSDMIKRDRNHPSVTLWGLLNETPDGPVFRQAVGFLPKLRALDETRLVLLGSGRWDCQWSIGSVSNPGSHTWERVWGVEAPDAAPAPYDWHMGLPGGYFQQAGDAHVYPATPQTDEINQFLRTLGQGTKPVLLSEYGIGSLMNVIRERRRYEQAGIGPEVMDHDLMRTWSDALERDWRRWGFDEVYAFPEDMLRESQRLHGRQRTIGFDAIRANPNLCGFNLTGLLDHGMTGEGLWTFWREWKPGIVDVLADGWAPLRWCLFTTPLHGYTGQHVHIEAVLANEDVLAPGSYPVAARIMGPDGLAWEKRWDATLPEPAEGKEAPLAVPVLDEEVFLDGPAGAYTLAVTMLRGGAPTGGRLTFHLTDKANLPTPKGDVALWGIDAAVASWLESRGLRARPFSSDATQAPTVILVGKPAEGEADLAHWTALARQAAQGSAVILLDAEALARGEDTAAWLPLEAKGRCYPFHDWLYHKECVARPHPAFAGLPGRGILDWDYYGQVIPRYVYEPATDPTDIAAASFAMTYPSEAGYLHGLLLASHRFGAGRYTLSTFRILEHVGSHPAADRLLLNLIADAQGALAPALAPLPEDWEGVLDRIGYR